MVYLKPLLISLQKVLLLAQLHNTGNIKICRISPIQQTISLITAILRQETGPLYGSLTLVENNQHQFNNLWKLYKFNNPQENATGSMSLNTA